MKASNSAFSQPTNLTQDEFTQAYRTGKTLALAIREPSQFNHKERRGVLYVRDHIETTAQAIARKINRRTGIPTRSSKKNNISKNGFPDQATNFLYENAVSNMPCGYLVVDFNLDQVKKIVEVIDAEKDLEEERYNVIKDKHLFAQAFERLKEKLHQKAVATAWKNSHITGLSIKYDVTAVQGIYFSYGIDYRGRHDLEMDKDNVFLQAIYIQKMHEKVTGVKLPILGHSVQDNTLKIVNYNHDDILLAWEHVLKKYFASNEGPQSIKPQLLTDLASSNFNKIKINSIYFSSSFFGNYQKYVALDVDYSPELKARLDAKIQELGLTYIAKDKENFLSRISEDSVNLLDNRMFFRYAWHRDIQNNPTVLAKIHATLDNLPYLEVPVEYPPNFERDFDYNNVSDVQDELGLGSSSILKILNDRASALQNPVNLKGFYVKRTAKIYQLAKDIGRQDLMDQIKELARQFIQQHLSKPYNKQEGYYDSFHLGEIMSKVVIYDLEEMLPLVKQHYLQMFAELSEALLNDGCSNAYCELIKVLNDYQFLTEEHKQSAQSQVRKFGELLIQRHVFSDPHAFEHYFRLAKFFKFTVEEQKRVLLSYFSPRHARLGISEIFVLVKHLDEAKLLDDKEIFELLIKQIPTNLADPYTAGKVSYYLSQINSLEHQLVKHHFNEMQTEVVSKIRNKNLQKMWDEFFDNLSPKTSIAELIDILSAKSYLKVSSNALDTLMLLWLQKTHQLFNYTFDEELKQYLFVETADNKKIRIQHLDGRIQEYVKTDESEEWKTFASVILPRITKSLILFKAFIESIPYSNHQQQRDIGLFKFYIEAIRKKLPQQKFTDEQQKIVNAKHDFIVQNAESHLTKVGIFQSRKPAAYEKPALKRSYSF